MFAEAGKVGACGIWEFIGAIRNRISADQSQSRGELIPRNGLISSLSLLRCCNHFEKLANHPFLRPRLGKLYSEFSTATGFPSRSLGGRKKGFGSIF